MNRQLAAAVIATFRNEDPIVHYGRLERFNLRDWNRSFHWLDASGLALYLLQRINDLGIKESLPQSVCQRLEQRHADNKRRTTSLLDECVRINKAFQAADVQYVNLKGFSLVPDYCPDLSLRYQLDSDFLVADADAESCREVLKSLGYSVVAENRQVMEFKTGRERIPDIHDLYKPKPQRSVELHLNGSSILGIDTDNRTLFEQARLLDVCGLPCPALPASDMFVAQATHLFRHLRSEWTRMSWLLEFRHCAASRENDSAFWEAVRDRVAGQPAAALGLAAATAITAKAFGDCGPDAWMKWCKHRMTPEVRLWVEHYGEDVMLSDYPGTKLYLFLEPHLNHEPTTPHTLDKLFPLHRPPAVTVAAGVTVRERLAAAKCRWKYFFFRLRFHVGEGFRYAWEARRWKRLSTSLLQPATTIPSQTTSIADVDSGDAKATPCA
jgi:hypothetical protein